MLHFREEIKNIKIVMDEQTELFVQNHLLKKHLVKSILEYIFLLNADFTIT